MNDLTPASALAAQETIIRRSLLEASAALAKIRDERLFEAGGFTDFDTYCRDRLGHGRSRADQIIAAGRRVAALPTNVGTGLNEAHVRALGWAADHPDIAAEILDAARSATGGKLTAAAITAAVEHRRQEAEALTDKIGRNLDRLTELVVRLRHRGRQDEAEVVETSVERLLEAPDNFAELFEELAEYLEKRDGLLEDLHRHIGYEEVAP